MKHIAVLLLFMGLSALMVQMPCWQPATAAPAEKTGGKIMVGYKEAPPFSIKEGGKWRGLSVELWRDIAAELEYDCRYREYNLAGLLQALDSGAIDVAVGALTITAEREKKFDFTHPFYSAGLGIAVKSRQNKGWLSTLANFFSWRFFSAVTGLAVLLAAIGIAIWLFERKANPDQFSQEPIRGIGAGFWWSAVTMTTVGYGDKAPRTLGGRIVGLVWMFMSIILISGFTAAIAASLTFNRMQPLIQGPEDLDRVRVGSVNKSTSAQFLEEKYISYRHYPNIRKGLDAVEGGEIDAFVYDDPMLRYYAGEEYAGIIMVLETTFLRQDYGFGLTAGSSLREPINLRVLRNINNSGWQDRLAKYLGNRQN